MNRKDVFEIVACGDLLEDLIDHMNDLSPIGVASIFCTMADYGASRWELSNTDFMDVMKTVIEVVNQTEGEINV